MNERATEVAIWAIPPWKKWEGARYQWRAQVDGAQGYIMIKCSHLKNGAGIPHPLQGVGSVTAWRCR